MSLNTTNLFNLMKTSIAVDKEFRKWIAEGRNKYLVENKLVHISIEAYLKKVLGYEDTVKADNSGDGDTTFQNASDA